MFKKVQWWHVILIMDISMLVLAITDGSWALCAAYFAVGYFGQKICTYLENN